MDGTILENAYSYSAQGDDLASACLVEAMGDGEDGAVFGGGLKGADDLALGQGIEIGGDLVEQQQAGIQRDGARDAEQLALSLREECWAKWRREPLRQLRADLCHAGERQRLLDGSLRDARIAQRNLVPHAAVDGREFLLDAAAEWTPLFSGDGARVEPADADVAGPRRVEAENQLEERRLADARAAGQRDGLAFAHGQGKIAKEGGPLAVAEGDMLYDERQLLLSR